MVYKIPTLADIQHSIWACWIRFMFSVGTFQEDGSWIMPVEKVTRWRRQSESHYENLSKIEQESDQRVINEHMLEHLQNAFLKAKEDTAKQHDSKSCSLEDECTCPICFFWRRMKYYLGITKSITDQ